MSCSDSTNYCHHISVIDKHMRNISSNARLSFVAAASNLMSDARMREELMRMIVLVILFAQDSPL